MKKEKQNKIVLLFVVTIIALATLASSGFLTEITGGAVVRQLTFCEDTDEGNTPSIKGTATYIIKDSPFYEKNARRYFTDYCSYGNALVEYYCTEKFNRVASRQYHCEKGCEDGACILPGG